MRCAACDGTGDSASGDPTRTCPACQGFGELECRVSVEPSIGTASGHEVLLAQLRRSLEKQLVTFCLGRGLKGKWNVVAYVSRERK